MRRLPSARSKADAIDQRQSGGVGERGVCDSGGVTSSADTSAAPGGRHRARRQCRRSTSVTDSRPSGADSRRTAGSVWRAGRVTATTGWSLPYSRGRTRPAARRPPPTACRSPPASQSPLSTARLPKPTAHFPLPTSCCPLPTSHFPPPTSHLPPPTSHRPPPPRARRSTVTECIALRRTWAAGVELSSLSVSHTYTHTHTLGWRAAHDGQMLRSDEVCNYPPHTHTYTHSSGVEARQ